MKRFINNQKGYTLIEVLVALSISLIICGLLTNVFISVLKNTLKINDKVVYSYEQILKDDYIRNFISKIEVPYWSTSDTNIDEQISKLKKHSYFNNKIKNIEYLFDSYGYKKGISITYELNNGQEQTTSVLFSSFSVLRNEK
ncbi:MAG: prepilin-type N-terminal cleavage/methylation domain-containing protein [Spirochaetaceae bacterium]|nr:prepilin-type N-terminal cleavage/methylation domain-containing protein [Spirochaetaceae bacterium]